MVHLCEMKFSETQYTITKNYAQRLTERRQLFMDITGESRGVVLTIVTPSGLKSSIHNNIIHSQVTARDLFYDVRDNTLETPLFRQINNI